MRASRFGVKGLRQGQDQNKHVLVFGERCIRSHLDRPLDTFASNKIRDMYTMSLLVTIVTPGSE